MDLSQYGPIFGNRGEIENDYTYRDLVVRDLEYYVIGLKTQCLWVTYIPIPGLHM